jgi:hypothetical protein
MESIIEKNMFGTDKIASLAGALGFNATEMMSRLGPEELREIVLRTRAEEIEKNGDWWGEVIDLLSYIHLIKMYRYSPEMQRKAYTALVVHIRGTRWPKYEKTIIDDAFGIMRFPERGEPDDPGTSSRSDDTDL